MKLTVLGNNGPFPAAGGACSGYLIQKGNTKILIDCGNGVLANLQRVIRFEDLDAILLTHLHSDHMSDMMVLRYAVQIKANRGQMDRLLDVYAPAEPQEEYVRLDIKNAYRLKPISEDLVLHFGCLTVTFREMTHPVKTFAVAITDGEKRFVFSGDTNWNESIIEFGKGADLLMLDAGLMAKDKTGANVPHLTAGECGRIAKEAGAKRLLLTHFWPEYDINQLVGEAKEYYYDVEAAQIMAVYQI